MLLPFTFTSVLFFLLLKLTGDKVHVAYFLLPLEWVGAEDFIFHYGLMKGRGDTI